MTSYDFVTSYAFGKHMTAIIMNQFALSQTSAAPNREAAVFPFS